ncbi:Fic family protein [Herbidospora daliensis]|uniref:Fic family protein n=1 Tax=Herbidospora daliensis TaxID=295585 RepID=UPI0007818576|nr:Fic family protein [Herbidospora daliensis]
MRIPQPPPPLSPILASLQGDRLVEVMRHGMSIAGERYLPWDEFRWRPVPEGLTLDEWWAATKIARSVVRRRLPLRFQDDVPFAYALPDEVLRGIENVAKQTSGRIGVPEPVTHDAPTRDQYVVNSLIEEAITSSQLEGASTTYQVAKHMLRSGRNPRTRDELMILNNYLAMRRVGELRGERLTPALIAEIHRIVTEGTLDDPATAGRVQLPGEERVVVVDVEGNVLHTPPPAEQLPERMEALCAFANGESGTSYVPPVVRAIVVHFMLSFDHPFVDGNGRTARVLFYWSMLNQDYWLTEFLSISRLIKQKQAQYGRSFLHCEQDEGDLTYFIAAQLAIISQAITDLHEYLDRKVGQTRNLQRAVPALAGHLNHRQIALLQNAIKKSDARYTVRSHSRSHNITVQTARTDLQALETRGLLNRVPEGRGFAWLPVGDLRKVLGLGS